MFNKYMKIAQTLEGLMVPDGCHMEQSEVTHCCRSVVLATLKNGLSSLDIGTHSNPAALLLGLYPKGVHLDAQVSHAHNSPNRTLPKYASAVEWTSKRSYVYTLGY